jgi:hypothetical protein
MDAVVFVQFGFQLLAAFAREAVKADFAIGFGDAPFGGDPAFKENFLKGRVEGAFLDSQDFGREGVNALGYGVSVKGAGAEDAENEERERA